MKSDLEKLSFKFGPINFTYLSYISIFLLTTPHFSLFYAGTFTKMVYKIGYGYIFKNISLPYKVFFGPESKIEREEFCKVNVPSMKMYIYAENVT